LNLTQRFGIPLPPDLVGFAARNLGITKGLDAAGSAALVVLKIAPDQMQTAGPPPMVLLLPTNDPAGMLSNFSSGDKDASGIQEVTLESMGGAKGYIAVVDNKWMAFTHDRAALETYMKRTGETLDKHVASLGGAASGAAAAKVFENNDLVLWWNVPALEPLLTPVIDRTQDQMAGIMDMANMTMHRDASAAAMQKVMIGLYFDAFRAVLRDAQGAMTTLRLNDAGVSLGNVAVMKEGSESAKVVSAQKPAGPLSLDGLPGGGFLFAMSAHMNGAALQDTAGRIANEVLADPAVAQSPNLPALKRAVENVRILVGLIEGGRAVMLDPPANGAAGEGLVRMAGVIDTTDSAKYMQAVMAQYQDKEQMNAIMGMSSPEIQMNQTVSPDAQTVKGLKLTKVEVTYSLREETADKPLPPGSDQALAMIKKMYGDKGMTVYIGALDPKPVVMVMGGDQASLEAAITAAQSKSGDLAATPGIAGAKSELVPNTVAVAYLPVGKWMGLFGQLVSTQMQAMGGAMPPGVLDALGSAKEAPPAVVSAGVTGTMFQYEFHAPVATISAIIDAAVKAKMAANGAAGPGGGGMP
jgi:hypothetical protein